MLEKATQSVGVRLDWGKHRGWLKWGQPAYTPSDCERRREMIHQRLQELAILLLPNAEILLVSRDYPCTYDIIEESGRELPALKTLALRDYYMDYHIHEGEHLYAAAPNLDTLYAMDPLATEEQNDFTTSHPWSLRLAGLRKLTLNNIQPLKDLELLLECCSSLAELHFSCLDYSHTSGWDMVGLMCALQPVKMKLRRLTLTWVPRNWTSDPEDPEPHAYEWALTTDNRHARIETFNDFEYLQFLAVDQADICLRQEEFIPSDRLIDFLPHSIREIHLYFVYRSCLAALEALVYEAPHQFPHLRVIHMSLADRIHVDRVKELEEMRAIDSIAQRVGIQVRWSTTRVGGYP